VPFAALLLPLILPQTTEKWRLHKFMQPIGWETAVRTGDETTVDFGFTDRGSPVKLTASLKSTMGLPVEMAIKGQTSRASSIDRQIKIDGRKATVIQNGKTTQVEASANAFPSPGYAPLAIQEAMLRFWKMRGKPKEIPNLVGGTVRIQERGTDAIRGKKLHRYSVQGVVWGRETLWADDSGALVAGVMCDAEFDHFEGLADSWEAELPTFVRKAAEETARDLATSLPPPKSPKKLALVGGRLIDGTGAAPVEDSVVLIENGRIAYAGPTKTVPKGFETVDVRGKTVMPGLWDMHAHYEQAEWGPIYLASGVTTVRDCGNEFDFITAARDANDTGGVGPRLILAGLVDGSGPMSLGIVRVDTEEEVKRAVATYKAAGFRQIKIYSSVKPDMVPIVVREAHAAGLTVTGHIPNNMTLREGIAAGMDMVNHIDYVVKEVQGRAKRFQPVEVDSPDAKSVIALMKEKGTVLDDTLTIYEMSLHRPIKSAEEIEPGIAFVAPELQTALRSGFGPGFTLGGTLIDSWTRLVVSLQKAGVPIVAGTDQTVPGFSLHRELELYVKGGMAPMDAIRAACAVPARVLGLEAEVGTLERGKRADVLIVDGNPLTNISDTRKVWMTIAKGRMYKPDALWKAVGFTPPRF
jgi:hypothetical protein